MVLRLTCAGVLFDLDGVLVDSAASVERQWRAWAADRGVDYLSLSRVMHGRRSVDTVRELAPHLDPEAEAIAVNTAQAEDEEGVVPIAGAPELLASMPAGRWGIVTSGPRMLAEARLRTCRLPLPKVLVCGDDKGIERGKPDPTGYLLGARRLGLEAGDCAGIEDSPAGLRAVQAAGMRSIGLLTSYTEADLDGATLVLPDLVGLRASTLPNGNVELRVAPAAGESVAGRPSEVL